MENDLHCFCAKGYVWKFRKSDQMFMAVCLIEDNPFNEIGL